MSPLRREDREYLARIDRARLLAKARGEEFNEDDHLRQEISNQKIAEALESKDPGWNEASEPEDHYNEQDSHGDGFPESEDLENLEPEGFDDDINQPLDDDEEFSGGIEASLDEPNDEIVEHDEGIDEPDPLDEIAAEDSWAEDDHSHRMRRGSEYSTNRGLYEAEQNAGNYYDSAHLDAEDGHGISVPRPSILEQDDSEKRFRRPESDEERHQREMERLARRYEPNEGVDEPTSIADFEENIVQQLDDLRTNFYADGVARSHYERKKNDSRYSDSAECERNELCLDADDRLDWFEERKKEDPSGSDLRLKHLDSIMVGLDDVGHRQNRERIKKEEIREMLENGEISYMTYDDAIQAIDCFSQRGKTAAGYRVISGGDSMYDDVGEIMDGENNLLDDVYAPNEEQLRETRRFIGELPREVSELCLDYAVDIGVLSQDQMSHLMVQAACPTYSMNRRPISKKNDIASRTKRFFGL